MKFIPFDCAACGGRVKLSAKAGRVREYRRGLALPVPREFRIPTCTECGEEYLSVEQAEELERLQAPAYREWQATHLKEVVRSIQSRHGVTLRQIEAACDITPTYLSHLLAGRKEASLTLVRLLEAQSLYPAEFERQLRGVPWAVAEAQVRATLVAAPPPPIPAKFTFVTGSGPPALLRSLPHDRESEYSSVGFAA